MSAGPDWTFQPVTADNWHDLTALFEGRGGPRQCWCMVWRKDTEGKPGKARADDRRAALQGLVQADRPIGLLGYAAGEPVAWCSLAPRPAFGKSLSAIDLEPGLWSLTCFFIRADHRRQSGFSTLVAAAEAHARGMGATVLEAYPVDPDSPSYRFSGFLPKYQTLGFEPIARVGTRRHVVRKALI
jgi:GNAT superfamily N-acetyltransferase